MLLTELCLGVKHLMKNSMLLLTGILAVGATAQGAGLLTFDGMSGHAVTTYIEDEIAITTVNPGGLEGSPHLHFDGPNMPPEHLAIHGGCCSSPYRFTEVNLHPFVLLSITIYGGSGATTVTSSTGQVVNLPGIGDGGAPLNFLFPENFVGLSFDWSAGSNSNTIAGVDNIAYDVVAPEPSSLVLIASALAGIIVMRRIPRLTSKTSRSA